MVIDKGSLLMTIGGLEIAHIPLAARERAIIDFYDMKQTAERNNDHFYALSTIYSYSFSYGSFYPNFFNMSWPEFHACQNMKGVSQRAFQLMQNFCQNPDVETLETVEDFKTKIEPHALTGYRNVQGNCEFVANTQDWERWHRNWYIVHPQDIVWENEQNQLFPKVKVIITILRRELMKKFENEGTLEKAQKRVSQIEDSDVANAFHGLVMKHKGDELEGYASQIGREICNCNYYKYEDQLSDMERQYAKSLREIYSIINKDGKMQFISIDFKHGMFEFHNEDGEHQGEYRFDGTLNSGKDLSHNLKSIEKWYRQRNNN